MSAPNHRRAGVAKRSLVCAITALAVATASCAGMHQVPLVGTSPGQPAVWQVKAGDTVRVTMRNGSSSEFKVQSVAPDAIVSSDGTRFDTNEIRSVERRGISSGKTALSAGTIVLGLLAVGLVGAILTLGDPATYRR